MKPKALIFIGFREKTDSIIAAKEAKYKTILLTRHASEKAKELFDEIIEDNILDVEVLKKITPHLRKTYRIKGIISNYEHYVVHRSFFAEEFGIPSCSIYSACCTRNKAMQRHALDHMKENIGYAIVRNLKQALRAYKKLGGDVYLKSIAGIKSRFIFHIKDEKMMKKAFESITKSLKKMDKDLYDDYSCCDFNFYYPDPTSTFLVEKAEQGEQITVATLIDNHKIWHAPSVCDVYTAASLGKNDSFLAYRILPSKHPKEIIKKAKKVAATACRILGLKNCSIHTELILRNDRTLKVIELASRMGGYRARMYKEAYEIDLNNILIKAVIGKETKTRKKAKKYISMIEIFPTKKGKFEKIENIKMLKNDPNANMIKEKAQKGDKVGLAKNGFEPVLSFHITGKTYKEVQEKSIEYQKNLKVKLS